jgi:transposase
LRVWKQLLPHADEYVLFKENMGEYLSVDETCLSQGELYITVTNKETHGRKGSLVAMIQGTDSDKVIHILKLVSRGKRKKVKEITLNLSPTVKRIASTAFPNAMPASDRFHVQRLMGEAISDMRIDYRWQAIDPENEETERAKQTGRKYIVHTFENGNTRKQLPARSRNIVLRNRTKWIKSRQLGAEILFREYPTLKEVYNISMELTGIYNRKISTGLAMTKFNRRYGKVEKLNLKFFKSIIQTVQNNYLTVSNCFKTEQRTLLSKASMPRLKLSEANSEG